MRRLRLLPSMLGALLWGCSSSSSSGGGRGPSGPPVTLAAGLADPYAIAVGSAGVYWSNVRNAAGTIMAAPTDGGSVTTLASGQSGPYGVAVDPTHVYWTDQTGGTVMMVPLTGGAATTLASGQLAPRGIAVDGAHVYWTCAVPCGSDGGPCGGAVMSVPLGGGTPVTLVFNQDTPWAIAVNATNVFWTNNAPGTDEGFNGTVMTVRLAGGTPITLASAQTGPSSIALDDTNVYWVNSGASNGTVLKCAQSGCAGNPTTLASQQDVPGAIAVDAKNVYWSNWGTDVVMMVPATGGVATTLALGSCAAVDAGQCNAYGLAADATRVAELHRVIAKAVIHKPARLSGAEVKFLRKHLGWSGIDFAAHMGVDPTTVSAWENERKPFGTSSDRLLHLMVARQAPVEDYSLDELTKIADVQGPPRQVEIRSKDHGWQIAA